MQRIERYGVIALVFLLVTIVAVSLWGERKEGAGLLAFLSKDGRSAKVEEPVTHQSARSSSPGASTAARGNGERMLPLAERQPLTSLPHARSPAPRPYQEAQAPGEPFTDRRASSSGQIPASAGGASLLPAEPAGGRSGSSVSTAADLQRQAPRVVQSKSEPRIGSYTVRRGDTLSEIAQRQLGTQARWRELLALNPGLDPQRLREGQTLRLPAGPAAPSSSPATPAPDPVKEPARGRSTERSPLYTVQPGDTLSEVAQRELGASGRWSEIVELNPGLDPHRLIVGQVLELPAAAPAERPASDSLVVKAEPPAPSRPDAHAKRSKVR